MGDLLIWLGIAICITQSATMSGLNLAVFSLSRLRLEVAANGGSREAARILAFRKDANFALATILWGNVAVNVLLTLLADSVLLGVSSFLFSTVVITIMGEIMPQAYFKRHALRVASLLSPLLRVYQILLWPVARPSGMLLDKFVGTEEVPWFGEKELTDMLRHHADAATTEVGYVEAMGAINFLALDDLPVTREGESIDPESILQLKFEGTQPEFPPFERTPQDAFLKSLAASERKWVVLIDDRNEPRLVLNANSFLREALFGEESFNPMMMCHRPLIIRNPERTIGQILGRLTVLSEKPGDDVIDYDLVLVWTADERRIITGADILGRLLRRIVKNIAIPPTPPKD
jgi:metal transporter CNNM